MSYQHITFSNRLEISILLKKGYFHREIARVLKKNHSSVSREIKNNSVNGVYDPVKAQAKSKRKRSKSKYQCMKIVKCSELTNYIEINLRDNHWTPEERARGECNKIYSAWPQPKGVAQ